jgi:hypothetical protein
MSFSLSGSACDRRAYERRRWLQFERMRGAGRVRQALRQGVAIPKVIDFGMAMRMSQEQSHASNIKQCASAVLLCNKQFQIACHAASPEWPAQIGTHTVRFC